MSKAPTPIPDGAIRMEPLKTFDWEAENDGYGIVGVSFQCPHCNHRNRFVSGELDLHECNACHKESMPTSDASDW